MPYTCTYCVCVCASSQQILLERLESTTHELQNTILERDRLSVTLEEALGRCTSSLVAKRLAEDECRALQQQLDTFRAKAIS